MQAIDVHTAFKGAEAPLLDNSRGFFRLKRSSFLLWESASGRFMRAAFSLCTRFSTPKHFPARLWKSTWERLSTVLSTRKLKNA